jgi:hypothetical protein
MKTEKIFGAFGRRHTPLNPDYRLMYKIGLIICILKKVTIGDRASLNKLHFLVWSIKSERNMSVVANVLQSQDYTSLVTWGVEPALNRALNFGVAEELLTLKDDKYALTLKGGTFYKDIEKDETLYKREKEFLDGIGKKTITETFITQLTSRTAN